MKTFEARTSEKWWQWLAEHHESESDVWLVYYKQHTGRESVTYEDSVDEALCFGWIDSLIRRLDDDRYARKFTPRKPDSKWSTSNLQRYAILKASGRLMPAGIKRPPTERSGDAPKPSTEKIPGYVLAALKSRPPAWKTFEGLPLAQRQLYLAWIDSAKRQETKLRRLDETIRLLAAGKKLGMK